MLFSSTILLWCIMLSSRTAFPFSSHIADHGHAAFEPKFSAVDLSGPGSLHDWRNVWLVLSQSSHNSHTLLREMLCKRHTGEEDVRGDVATCVSESTAQLTDNVLPPDSSGCLSLVVSLGTRSHQLPGRLLTVYCITNPEDRTWRACSAYTAEAGSFLRKAQVVHPL